MSLAIRFSRFLDKTPFHSRKSLPPTENPEFVYPPLDEAKREIRYLILLPGKRNDPVRGLLVVAPMTKLDCPNFEALSYVWGSKENSTEVAIKSVSDVEAAAVLENADSVDRTSRRFDSMFGIVRITQNLARALPYLRYLSKPRRLWIDAICINQDDADERSSQVQRMRDVYSLASRVVVWLGPGTADTELAFATLEKINSKFYFDDRRSVVNVISHDPSNVEVRPNISLVFHSRPT